MGQGRGGRSWGWRTGPGGWRRWASGAAGAAAGLAGPVVAAAVTFVAVGSRLVLVLPIVVAAVAGLWAFVTRIRGHRLRPWLTGVVVGAGVSVLWWTSAAIPLGAPSPPATPHLEYWHLTDGSTIAYVGLSAAERDTGRSPVIFLHGGPGIAEIAPLTAFARSLGVPDRSAFVYDEVGAGASSRLDPDQYGIDRDVADLEAIRRTIGARQLVLVGHSYGAWIAAAYAARHPDRVERMVLVSPGPIDPEDHSTNNLYSRFSSTDRWRVFGYAVRPRPLATYVMSLLDPRRARGVVSDAEADAISDELVNRAAPALYCEQRPARPQMETGSYRMQVEPLPPTKAEAADLREGLPRVVAPTLILKGSCDYLSWDSAMDYWRLLPASRICYVEGAGHNVLEERADYVPGLVRRFIVAGQWCHDAAGEAPASYEGRRP